MKINIQKELKRIVRVQSSHLKRIVPSIDSSFTKAVQMILRCKGKVVVTGIGKSGLVAQKISSTLSSTGTPSIYLHPVEALHGNLGVVHKNDVIFAIGKSGESEELLELIPSLKKIGAPVIALTSNKNSSLARKSSVVLTVPVTDETCPFNLAPTTSSMIAMVVGDAMAIALMKLRGFGPDRFALYHPAGLLGKKLLLKVSDIMRGGTGNPVVKINTSMPKLLAEISRKWAGAASVVDRKGKFLGLITDYDIRRHILEGESLLRLPIEKLMNRKPTFVYSDEMAVKAAALMENRKKPFTVLPVLDRKKRSVGIVHANDLIQHGLVKSFF